MSEQPLYNARYRLLSEVPQDLWCGDALLLNIELTNLGLIPWITFGPHPVRLSYHWRTPQGQPVVEDGRRTLLPHPVAPHQTVTFEMRAESPPAPGDYHLVVELVEEGIGWFAEQGVAPLVLPVSYAQNSAPRACIINGNVVAHDAVGGHVISQLQVLRQAGYHTLLLTEFVDERLPVEVRRNAVALKLPDLHTPGPNFQHAIDHFYSSDIVILNYSTYYELAEAIKLVQNAIVIFDYHGVTPPEIWGADVPGYLDLVRGQENIRLVQYADFGIGHSSFTRDELVRTGLIPPDRTRVLPYAVVPGPIRPQPHDPQIIAQHGLQGKRVLLYVGRMARNKRIIDLVEALALVRKRHPETVLLLVGDNQFPVYRDYAADVRKRAEELGCRAQVIFTGQVPDIEPYYQLCDLFVTASIHEGFCMPVVEAMARGKPVVATAATALPETVGAAGLLCEPQNPADMAEKIVRLLDDLPPPDGRQPALQPDISSNGASPARIDGKIAFVAPRYGLEILGGAEKGMRSWAEQLAAQGYTVEVLTTCTREMAGWANYYEPGVEELNGVLVRRFRTDAVDAGLFHSVLAKANTGEQITYADEQIFMQNNLQSSDLNRYLREHADEYVCAVFTPYLFGTTYYGAQAIADKAIILPCLHDEPSARLQVFHEMIEGAAGIFYNSEAERAFAEQVLGVVNPHAMVIGYGFPQNPLQGDGAAFRQRHNLPEQLLLYSGRLEYAKNVPLLLDYFVRYKTEHPGPLTLVLAGAGDVPVPARPDIITLGMIKDPQVLADVYAAATLLCQPSLNESFSIVIMESWLQSRPVMVHADCAVTRDHVVKSRGGYTFDSYESFRDSLQRLVNDPAHARELGRRGRDYVLANYTWDVITERIIAGIAAFTHNRSTYSRLAQRGYQQSLRYTRTRLNEMLFDVVAQAQARAGVQFKTYQRQRLAQLTQVGNPGYTVQSHQPVVGRLVAWARRQLTAHLKEPYVDPMIQRQETFNRELVDFLMPLLEQSLREQRRLRREVEVLRERLAQMEGELTADRRPLTRDDGRRKEMRD